MTAEPYHEVRAALALHRIANGEVPSEFCSSADPNLPSNASSLDAWAKADSAFAERLAEARALGASVMLAECKKIADDRSIKADQKRLMIDTRMKIAAIWNPAECNPKTVVESNVLVRNLTPQDQYLEQVMSLLGLTREEALAHYRAHSGGLQ